MADGCRRVRDGVAGAGGVGGRVVGVAGQLPVELSTFVGRGTQVDRGVALAGQARLLSLVGAGGVGKTRLALRVASRLADPDVVGVWWVELAAVTGRAQVEEALSGAVGLPTAVGSVRWVDVLAEYLGPASAVIVLDNCEHLLDELAPFVDDLLRACAGLAVLATSREPLGVEGELVWRVPPLETPPDATDAEAVWDYEAVRLFVARAAVARPELVLAGADADVVARICRALDGMPLAVELAAARVGAMPLPAILPRSTTGSGSSPEVRARLRRGCAPCSRRCSGRTVSAHRRSGRCCAGWGCSSADSTRPPRPG